MSVIINIDHEEGDLSEYTSTVEDSGDLSVTAGAALAGTGYGLECVIDDTNSIYGQKNFTKQAILRWRFYIDPNSLTMGDADGFVVGRLTQNGGSFMTLVYQQLQRLSGSYRLRIEVRNDADANVLNDVVDITDAPHYVEVQLVRAATDVSADGTAEWWVDGVSQGSASSIDNYNIMNDVDLRFRLGAESGIDYPTTYGTFYLDELIVNDDGSEIGPVSQTKSVSDTGTGIDILSQLTASLSFIDNGVGSDDVIVTEVLTSGSVCWGHVTGVIETNIRTFVDNWTGTGAISGSGDGEQMCLDSGQYMESEIVKTGVISTTLIQNNYAAGDTVALKYRHGVDSAACLAASWNDYTIPFESLGYVQVRVEYAL